MPSLQDILVIHPSAGTHDEAPLQQKAQNRCWMISTLVLWWGIIAVLRNKTTAWFVIGALVLGYLLFLSVLKLYPAYCRWEVERRFLRMSPEEHEAECAKALSEASTLLQEMEQEAQRERECSGVAWYWRTLDLLFMVICAFGARLLLSLVRRQPFSWGTQLTLADFLAFGCGVALYCITRAVAIHVWRQKHGTNPPS